MSRLRLAALPALALVAACRSTPGPSVAAAPGCEAVLRRGDARALVQGLERVSLLPPAWDDYSLRRHPVLIVARDTGASAAAGPACVILWRSGRAPVAIHASAEPRYSTPLYGFFNADTLGARARSGSLEGLERMRRLPADLAATVERLGVRRAVVLPLQPDLARLGPVGAELAKTPGRLVAIQADLAVHEGFHLHAQFPRWFDQPSTYPWPTWDAQPDRALLVRDCYGVAADSAALRVEHAALVNAFRALWTGDRGADLAGASLHLREYVSARRARQARLAAVRIPAGTGPMTCAVAEDVMELQEGAAQWIGHSTTVRAGLNATAALERTYASAQRERFYQTGAMQLWVLEAVHGPRAMRRITASLARSPGPGAAGGSIFERVAATVEGQSPRGDLPVP